MTVTDLTTDTAIYTTDGESTKGTPLESILPSYERNYNVLTLMQLLLESKSHPNLLPTILPQKRAPDLLVETYAKFGHLITYDAPSYSSTEQFSQAIRQNLRQQIREQYGIVIPGTTGKETVGYVPLKSEKDVIVSPVNNIPYYAMYASDVEGYDEYASLEIDLTDEARHVSPFKVSVAGYTAKWLRSFDRLLKTRQYKRAPDVVTNELRIVSYAVKTNARNPEYYPTISFLCSVDLTFLFDVFINNERLELFKYADLRINELSIPMSLRSDPVLGAITDKEFVAYTAGLTLAYIRVQALLRNAKITSTKKHTVTESRT